MKALVGAFNQEKALVGAFSVIVKTDFETDEALHSTTNDHVNITSMPLLQRRRLQCDCCKETNLDLLTAGGCAFLLLLFMAHPLCVQIQMSGKGSTPNNLHGYEIQTRIFLPSAAWCLLPEPNYSQQSKISKVLQFRY